MIHYCTTPLPHHLFAAVILVANVVAVLAPKQLQAELILPTSPLHFATLVGNPIVAVCTAAVKVAQKVGCESGGVAELVEAVVGVAEELWGGCWGRGG